MRPIITTFVLLNVSVFAHIKNHHYTITNLSFNETTNVLLNGNAQCNKTFYVAHMCSVCKKGVGNNANHIKGTRKLKETYS